MLHAWVLGSGREDMHQAAVAKSSRLISAQHPQDRTLYRYGACQKQYEW